MIKVLNHGFVQLVDWMGNDLAIVRAARVLPDAEWRPIADPKLIKFMLRERHSTPFEAVTFNFYVRAPIFVWRQWQRHRTWPFWSINEQSARYQELPEGFYIPDEEIIGEQSTNNRQGRQSSTKNRNVELLSFVNHCADSFTLYRRLLEEGWPRELARCVLPLNTFSTLSGRIDLWNLLHFLDLRLDPHAQWEIQQYAKVILDLIREIVPTTVSLWEQR